MKGEILTYKSSKRRDIVDINYSLFGRVAKIKKNNGKEVGYYYPGELHNKPFFKFSSGCYFVKGSLDNDHPLIKRVPADVEITDGELNTAKEKWGKFETEENQS